MNEPRALLTIAGSDPSGGAGLPVDLQVFRDFGFHGLSALTAVVCQNTVEVRRFEPVDAERLAAQLEAIFDDIPVEGIKIGMLATPDNAEAVADTLQRRAPSVPTVLDPVFAAGGGTESLASEGLTERLRERLFEETTIVTPNIPEAEAILDRPVSSALEMERAAEELVELGAESALLKAGHLPGEVDETIRDLLAIRTDEGVDVEWLSPLPRIDADARGTGCQLSSALAGALVDEDDLVEATESSREYLNDLLRRSTAEIGTGRPIVIRTGAPREQGAEP